MIKPLNPVSPILNTAPTINLNPAIKDSPKNTFSYCVSLLSHVSLTLQELYGDDVDLFLASTTLDNIQSLFITIEWPMNDHAKDIINNSLVYFKSIIDLLHEKESTQQLGVWVEYICMAIEYELYHLR